MIAARIPRRRICPSLAGRWFGDTEEVGRLVPVGDPGALADAITAVLASPERYDAPTLRGRALERFSWDSVVERILAVYRLALA